MINWIKRYPVLISSTIFGAYAVALVEIQNQHLVSGKTLGWLLVVSVVITFLGGIITHSVVTPVAAPRDNAGNALVPATPSTSVSETVPPNSGNETNGVTSSA